MTRNDMVYILDEQYNVWDFTPSDISLLSKFIDIKGVKPKRCQPAVITWQGSIGYYYAAFDTSSRFPVTADMKRVWREVGWLIGEDLQIYTPRMVMSRNLKCLLSESGDLLVMYLDKGDVLDIDTVTTNVRGFIRGENFTVIISEKVTISNSMFLSAAKGIVNVIFDFHGDDKAYEKILRRLSLELSDWHYNVTRRS